MAAITAATIGFPRIGKNRELKKALESYWKGNSSLEDLLKVSSECEDAAWKLQKQTGIDRIGLDGTLYDQVLDFIFYLGLAPERFQHLSGYAQYFAMARGVEGTVALDMSKFFDTNYHYMVPELDSSSKPTADWSKLIEKVKRGQSAVGKEAAIPIIIGPNTIVGLSKQAEGVTLDASKAIASLLPAYTQLLQTLKGLGVPEVQIHEPILTTHRADSLKANFSSTYAELAKAGLAIDLVTYYDDIGAAYPWVVQLPVQAISLDFLGVPGSEVASKTADLIEKHGFPEDKRLGAGVVDGRSVWADGDTPSAFVAALQAKGIKHISVQSSVSLQHLPYDVALETGLPKEIDSKLSFATQKLKEIVKAKTPSAKGGSLTDALPAVGNPVNNVPEDQFNRPEEFEKRRSQQISFHAFPTTSIGSFPQTAEIRRARLQFKKGTLSAEKYEKEINEYISYSIREQEKLGVDVLVHGEPERTDMVEFFGVKLDGFHFTEHGWVQSYGSRYVRPPIIYADVKFTAPMTTKEFKYAQSLTEKPVKGMLTGPVTILNWSFPRKDITRKAQSYQLALALRKEVAALEEAGCKVIQVDEPALREGLPLKQERWQSYLEWAVKSFRLATAVAKSPTQIVTHLCYSEFADILEAIDGLEADVLTIENSRSGNEMINALAKFGYSRDVGPGVYDVHSPVVPSVEFMSQKIQSFLDSNILKGRTDRIWVNPDCGLKTREWKQVLPSIDNMVKAASNMRAAKA